MVRVGPGKQYVIHEAVELALEFREDRLWLLFNPTVHLATEAGDRWQGTGKSDLIRELLASRYNRQSSELVNLWLDLLMGATDSGMLAFSPTAPESATFGLRRALPISSHAA